MKAMDRFTAELRPGSESLYVSPQTEIKIGVGILIHDPMNRRLIEAATTHLELVLTELDPDHLEAKQLALFEMIISDVSYARQIQTILNDREQRTEGLNPAIVAVHLDAGLSPPSESDFDGVLSLPLEPAPLIAQLSLMLYAHRAFARKYHTALEELNLNRRIFRSVTSAILVAAATEPDMPLIYVNPAFEVMTGYTLEEVIGKNCRFLQGDDNDQPGLTIIRDAIRDRREAVAVLKNYRKDGTFFWNELSLSPIRNREGVVTHIVGIQADATARVEFEAALLESEKLAAVGRLASSIAHEINNPLESVMNLLYLAQNTEDSAEIQRFLKLADQELRRVALITTQSLRFYKQSTRPLPIHPTELMKAVISMYAGQLENSNVTVHPRFRSDRTVICLESELRQVLNNLVRNALDAMRATGGRLLVRTRDTVDWRSGVRGVALTIADTGSGISAEAMKKIYKPFFTTKGISGTGLGLWISSEIVTRQKGRLLVRSSQRPNRTGTVFTLFLSYENSVSEGSAPAV